MARTFDETSAESGFTDDRGAVADPIRIRSRSGGLVVVTTPAGLPISLRIEPAELHKDTTALADEILRLCRRGALTAGVRLRAELVASGVAREVIDDLCLPKPDELADDEYREDLAYGEPATWLRRH